MRDKERKSSGIQRNILLVANYESDVGYAWWLMENFWVEIARYFHAHNRECFLIYPRIHSIPANIREAPIHVIEHDFSDRTNRSMEGLKTIIRDNDIVSIYLTDKKLYDAYYMLLRVWGIKNIVLHDHGPGEYTLPRFHIKLIKKLIHAIRFLSCDYYIGVSKFIYNRFVHNGCIAPKKCSYVLNGIKPIEIKERFRFYAHGQFNIPKDATIIVTTGRATFYKGLDFLIECANILIRKEKYEKLYFLHCGDGPDLDTFKEMVKIFRLTDRFIFAGRRSDIPLILQSCHVGIQASIGEAFSLSILEYMSAGLATVVPDHCGNSEAITDGSNGVLYPPGNLNILAGLLSSLVRDAEYRKNLGDNAIKTVRDKLNIQMTNNALIKQLSDKL